MQAKGCTLEVPPADALLPGRFACYDAYVGLMRECWSMDPADRPPMAAVASRLREMLSKELRLVSSGGAPGGAPPDV